MTRQASTAKLTPRGTKRRSEIIDAATSLFAARGYHPTSIADIVGAIGVGKGVFYWYFDSKEQLFAEMLRDGMRSLRRHQRDALVGVDDPVARIAMGLRAAVLWSATHRELMSLLEFANTDERFVEQMRRGREISVGDVVPHLEEAIAVGRIAPRDPQLLAHAILGVASNLTRVFIHQMDADARIIGDEVVTFCLAGIGADIDHDGL